MAFDEDLANVIRRHIGSRPGVTERRMFGGIGFMVDGNMAVGVSGDELMVRVGRDAHEAAVAEPGVRIFDGGARPMQGWVLVDPAAFDDAGLGAWIERGVVFASSLPTR